MEKRGFICEVITAIVTPFDKDKEINYNKFGQLVKYLIENGTDGLLVAGTTGESPTLTNEEELELLFEARSSVGNNVKIIMGAGSNCTKTAIETSQKAQENGADAILSVVPYYNKPGQVGIYEHFSQIAKNIDIPIILYNIPGRTGVNMMPKTVATLSNDYKNIIGIKQSNPDLDLVSEMVKLCSKDFSIYCGDDSLTLPMLALGAVGTISVASHIVGKEIKSMIEDFKSGNIESALKTHIKLYPVFKKIFMAPNPIPIKETLSKIGLIDKYVRLPLVNMTVEEECELFEVIKDYINI